MDVMVLVFGHHKPQDVHTFEYFFELALIEI